MKPIFLYPLYLLFRTLTWPAVFYVKRKQAKIKKQYIQDPISVSTMDAYLILKDLAWGNYKEANFAFAEKSSKELLRLSEELGRNWNYGNAIHHSHTILGLIKLNNKDLIGAKNHLKRSAKTPGSPQLNTIGPCFLLAQNLIDLGEKQAVINFLKDCLKFWERDNGRLSLWVNEINNNQIPIMYKKK